MRKIEDNGQGRLMSVHYNQKELEDQIIEEGGKPSVIYALNDYMQPYWDYRNSRLDYRYYYTKGKTYPLLGEDENGYLIITDTRVKAYATKELFTTKKMNTVTAIRPAQIIAGQIPRVTTQEIKSLLRKGYTRYSKDDKGYGSIQVKYNLTRAQVANLFKDKDLIGLKTRVPGVILEKSPIEDEVQDMEINPFEDDEDMEIEPEGNDEDTELFS